MPSADLLPRFDDHLVLEQEWEVSGRHYARTARAWLDNLDAKRTELLEILERDGSDVPASVELRRWRVFFLACEELWAFRGGKEWFVQHYLFSPYDPGFTDPL